MAPNHHEEAAVEAQQSNERADEAAGLSTEAALQQDLDRIAEDCASILVEIQSDDETKMLTVRQCEGIHQVIAEGFAVEAYRIAFVRFGEDPVHEGDSFEDIGAEDGARLSVRISDPTESSSDSSWHPQDFYSEYDEHGVPTDGTWGDW